MKIIAKIELSNVDKWDTDFDCDYEKKKEFDVLENDLKKAISEKCGIEYSNISIEFELEK